MLAKRPRRPIVLDTVSHGYEIVELEELLRYSEILTLQDLHGGLSNIEGGTRTN